MVRIMIIGVMLGLLSTVPGVAGDTFLDSDEYEERDGGAIGMFLHDDDYAVMVEDLERNDTTFDWAWLNTKTTDCAAASRPETGGRINRLIGKIRGPRCPPSTALAFDLQAARTVFVAPIENHSGLVKKELLAEIRDDFVQAMSTLGLQVVQTRDQANLALEVAVVDQMRNDVTVPVYSIHIDPFISLELRLLETKAAAKLLLVRNRKHGDSVADAAYNYADDLVKFLR
jgi:hypothetical protein